MPAIYLFQRRTLYGGDDLHLLALSTAAVRGVQLLCYSILIYHIVHHVQVVQQQQDETIKAAAFTTTLQDEMYVRRRRLSNLILPETTTTTTTAESVNRPASTSSRHEYHNLGISLLEYAWMDAVASSTTQQDADACRHSHLFPLLLMSYTAAGVLFGLASLVLLVQIYRTSSKGCPTMHRHPRTETMEQYLEWLFLPLNVIHFLIWIMGLCAVFFGYTYSSCEQDDNNDNNQPSTWFMVIWILAGILLLLSQAIEVFWNFAYVLALYHHDPYALHWTPNSSTHGSISTTYSSAAMMDNTTAALQPAVQTHYENHELVEQMWADRCHNVCRCLGMGTCYIFGGRELYGGGGAMQYGDFARAMADYLETRGVLDVVPSDILTGFLILQQVQNQRRLRMRHELLSEQFSYNNPSVAGLSTASSTSKSSRAFATDTTPSNPQLNNHRANAKSPNGMRLQRTPSQEAMAQKLLRGPHEASSNSLLENSNEALLQPLASQQQSSQRPVLLQSMGSGSVHKVTIDAATSGNGHTAINGHTNGHAAPNGGGIMVDQNLPPASPNPHKPRTAGTPNASAPPSAPFARKSFQRILSEHNHADVAILEEGARYSKYALAIYSWYLYLYVNPISGIPKLLMKALNTKKKCGCCWQHYQEEHSHHHASSGLPNSASSANLHAAANNQSRWEGDNICEAHKHALLLAAGLENEADLVYVQFKSSFNENPYCILLDHETQAVVVAVRGTFSLEDCVTDVLLEPESMEPFGDEFGFAEAARGQYCHGGVLACARNVYRDLKRHGSLDYLLGTKYPHYRLRLVGHSLGAASSTLLGFMLRQTYPTLRCFNYSPPGCTLTWDLAVQCQTWCTSFVLDTEVVPRMSFEALEYLRDEVLDLIGRIKVSKIEVARRVVTKTLWCGDQNNGAPSRVRQEFDVEAASTRADEIGELLEDLLLPGGEAPPADVAATSYRQQLEQFQSIQSERRLARGTRRAIRLFPPGRILHLVKTDEEQNCMVHVAKCMTCCMSNAGSQYTPVWIGNGDLNEIVISPTMGTDHFPDRMMEELQGIAQNFGVGPPYR